MTNFNVEGKDTNLEITKKMHEQTLFFSCLKSLSRWYICTLIILGDFTRRNCMNINSYKRICFGDVIILAEVDDGTISSLLIAFDRVERTGSKNGCVNHISKYNNSTSSVFKR